MLTLACLLTMQEHSLERTLDKMQGEWVGVSFQSMAWRSTNTSVLRGVDDIQMLLDDQIVKTQSMRASPYIGPFEDRVRLWEAKLNTTQVSYLPCCLLIDEITGRPIMLLGERLRRIRSGTSSSKRCLRNML